MGEAHQDKRRSLWPSLVKNLARRAVNSLVDWLLGLAVGALLTTAFLLKPTGESSWRASCCASRSQSWLARWTMHAVDRAHSRTPSNKRRLVWYLIILGIEVASLLPVVVAAYFLGNRRLPLWLAVGLFAVIDVAINTLWGVRYPNQPIRPGEPPFALIPPIRHLRNVWREALCYTLATVGGLLFCRSRDWRLRRHAWQSILIDMMAVWALVPLALVAYLLEELNPPRPRLVAQVVGAVWLFLAVVPRLTALARVWHGKTPALPLLWKMSTGLTSPDLDKR